MDGAVNTRSSTRMGASSLGCSIPGKIPPEADSERKIGSVPAPQLLLGNGWKRDGMSALFSGRRRFLGMIT